MTKDLFASPGLQQGITRNLLERRGLALAEGKTLTEVANKLLGSQTNLGHRRLGAKIRELTSQGILVAKTL